MTNSKPFNDCNSEPFHDCNCKPFNDCNSKPFNVFISGYRQFKSDMFLVFILYIEK